METDIFNELIEKFDINPTVDVAPIKVNPIPREWVNAIILETIDTMNKSNLYEVHKSDKNITLFFNESKKIKDFNESFNKMFFRTMNEYIEKLGHNPKEYKRIIVIEKTEKHNMVSINYV